MGWVIPDFMTLTAWWGFWSQIYAEGLPQLVLYKSNEPILHQTTHQSDYVTIAGDGFPMDVDPMSWPYTYTYTGVVEVAAPPIDWVPSVATAFSGWLIVSRGSRTVLCGDRLYAPPITIDGGETVKITIKEQLSDHGPKCGGE